MSWESIEGDFKLNASCSSIGEVQFKLVLWGLHGAPDEYRIEAGLMCEFGQLKKIAKESQTFFSQ